MCFVYAGEQTDRESFPSELYEQNEKYKKIGKRGIDLF
jgi:hypothetical protein